MTKTEINNKGKKLQATVVKLSSDKTVKVAVSRFVKDRKYKKYIKRVKKYLVHNTGLKVNEGDLVEIREVRPISKMKKFKLLKVVKEAVIKD